MPIPHLNSLENILESICGRLQLDWAEASLHCVGNNDPLSRCYALWQALEQQYGQSGFAIEAARTAAEIPGSFAQLACICSPDLNTAFDRFNAVAAHSASNLRYVIDSTEAGTGVGVSDQSRDVVMPDTLAAAAMAYIVILSRISTGHNIRPVAASLPLPHEDSENVEKVALRLALSELFGQHIESGPAHLVFSQQDMNLGFLTNSPEIWSAFEMTLSREPSENGEPLGRYSDRVQEALYALLPVGHGTVERVARKLAISKRTLQRKLSAEGQTYQRLLHRTRKQLSHFYLARQEIPFNEIASRLGYRDPHSFLRAYRGWTGHHPRDQRETPVAEAALHAG